MNGHLLQGNPVTLSRRYWQSLIADIVLWKWEGAKTFGHVRWKINPFFVFYSDLERLLDEASNMLLRNLLGIRVFW